jgi:hypothetical protein
MRAVIHVGAPKTGSTYLQHVMWSNRDSLLSGGVDMLGENQAQHYRAGTDLRDIPFDPDDPGVDWSGAWDRMARRAANSSAPVVVVSDEHLAAVTPEQAHRAVASLSPREVHVVYVTRDLPGLLPSEWQEFVKHGSTLDFETWVRRVFDEPAKKPGRWFWSVQNPADVVRRWSSSVPAENVHVIAMPLPGSPPDQLWELFATTLDVEPSLATETRAAANPSLGHTATELLRRVNAIIPDDFPQWHRTGLVRNVLANKVLNPLGGGDRPPLPDDLSDKVLNRARVIRHDLEGLGADIVGSLPAVPDRLDHHVAEAPTDADLTSMAVQALAGLVVHLAGVRDDRRASERLLSADAETARQEWVEFKQRHPVAVRIDVLRHKAGRAVAQRPRLARAVSRVRTGGTRPRR